MGVTLRIVDDPTPRTSEDLEHWFSRTGDEAASKQRTLRWRARIARLAAAVAGEFVDHGAVWLGLVLLARGCYLVTPAAGWIVPGAILVWFAIPQRPRFLIPKPPQTIILPPERNARDSGTPGSRA